MIAPAFLSAEYTVKVKHLFVLWLNFLFHNPAFPQSAQDICPANTRGLIILAASMSHASRQAPWWY
jgi:hypothetical protein